jgi:hexosaminidase
MFRTIHITLLLSLFLTTGRAQEERNRKIDIIPEPVSLVTGKGSFQINNHTSIFISPEIDEQTRTFLTTLLRTSTGNTWPVIKASHSKEPSIQLMLNTANQSLPDKEGYSLNVSSSGITIHADETAGLFYGIQSLLQLLPPTAIDLRTSKNPVWNIPEVQITDQPRFAWRGVMLDVGRHFFPKPFIESLLDEMAKYKFNVFHWHLTDDQGWRIEIKGLPNLTDIGAWRVPRTGGRFGYYEKPKPGEKATYGGFYTQDEIREVVKYAADRHITIVPEIDVPAHSRALIASYPNLACHQRPAFVSPGSPMTKDEENALCVANDSSYIILDQIFSQVAELFPGPYIHLGGDEAYKGFWASCPKDQQLMAQQHLSNTEELQSYFVKKVADIINKKGKKVIGWEEILQGGLAPGTVLMSWTSMRAGKKAAALGHQVIMTPWNHGLYMDNSPIETSYQFEPVPDSVDKNLILGGEGCLWTENVPTERQAEYMYWPRLMALSENFWTPKEKKDWNHFTPRLETHLQRLSAENIKYSKMIYDPIVTVTNDSTSGITRVALRSEIEGVKIYYSFDGTEPDKYAQLYGGTSLISPAGATDIKAVIYRGDAQLGKVVNISLKDRPRRSRHNDDD